MPRVPILQPQQRLSPLPGPNLSSNMTPDMLGASQGRAMQRLGNEALQGGVILNRMEADEQMRINHVRITDAMNQAVAAQLDLTHDPQTGFSNIRGKNALERPNGMPLDDEYVGKLSTRLGEISGTLGNDYQKQQFQAQADQMLVGFRGSLQQHVSRASTEYSLSVAEGTIKLARMKMPLEYGNPNSIVQATNAIKKSAADVAKLKGMSEQDEAVMTIEQLSPGHLSVIQAAADGGSLAYAQQYLKSAKAEMTENDIKVATNTVDAGAFEARTQGLAEKYLAKAKGNHQLALKLVREGESGKDEDGTTTRIKQLFQEKEMFRQNGERQAEDQAWKLYTGGQKIPPSVLSAMGGQARYSLQQAQKAGAEGGVKTNLKTYADLSAEMAQDPDAFAKRNLLEHVHELAPTDFKHFIDRQQKADKPENLEVVNFQSQVNTMTELLGLKGEKKGLFNKTADTALNDEQLSRNRKLTQLERQAVLDRLAHDVVTHKGTLYSSTSTYYEAVGEGKTPVEFNFTTEQKQKIFQFLVSKGENPSPERVMDVLRERLLLNPDK
jgi:hypothetical protein